MFGNAFRGTLRLASCASARRTVGLFALTCGAISSHFVLAAGAEKSANGMFREMNKEDFLVLFGVGNTSLFSFAVFVRPHESRKVIKKADAHALCKALLEAHTEKRVELAFGKQIQGSDLESFFINQLSSRSKHVELGELAAFAGQFHNQTLTPGTKLHFAFLPDLESTKYEVRTKFDGRELIIRSDGLAQSLAELFLLEKSTGLEASAEGRKETFLRQAKEMSHSSFVFVV